MFRRINGFGVVSRCLWATVLPSNKSATLDLVLLSSSNDHHRRPRRCSSQRAPAHGPAPCRTSAHLIPHGSPEPSDILPPSRNAVLLHLPVPWLACRSSLKLVPASHIVSDASPNRPHRFSAFFSDFLSPPVLSLSASHPGCPLAPMIDFPSPILSVSADVVKDLDGEDALYGMWTGA